MLTRPPWIQFGDVNRRRLRFLWDDLRVNYDFTGDATRVVGAAIRMSIRARLVLLVGLYEWVVWRFDGLHQRPEPAQIAEAAWCGTVDPAYLRFFELPREEWVGPVDGPLWCAFTFLEHGFRNAQQNHLDTYQALEFVFLLAWHVIPARRDFEAWTNAVLKRCVDTFPTRPEDPFVDLFEERVAQHLGGVIGRDALNPALPPDAVRDRAFLVQALQQARAERNPFLATEGDLKDRAFRGVPYTVP